MCNMSVEEFKEFIKNNRNGFFETPYELVYRVFCENGFDAQTPDFFAQNASSVVEILREGSWNSYLPREREFISLMLNSLINVETIDNLSSRDAVSHFIETYPDYMYQLSLSVTNSRRSRAGKEFEAIIELILMGAGIPMDTQGNIGRRQFADRGLGKLVDVVSPGVVEYYIERGDVVLISAKTTLRERWQEVPEEMDRTGAGIMYLATLDENISDDVLQTLYDNRIRVTTTRSIKEEKYPNNDRVLDFENLIRRCLQAYSNHWENHDYTIEQSEQIRNTIELQIRKHQNHDFVIQRYANRLQRFAGNE